MYFDSKRSGRRGLPWMDGRSDHEKKSDEYYGKLEALVERIDDIESETRFITELEPEDFDSSYQYVSGRIQEFKKYLKDDFPYNDSIEYTLAELEEIRNDLTELETEAILYDDDSDLDCDDIEGDQDDDDWDDDNWDDDDSDDDDDNGDRDDDW